MNRHARANNSGFANKALQQTPAAFRLVMLQRLSSGRRG
jgi:hypothetical protein